jgi:hypothetical protein
MVVAKSTMVLPMVISQFSHLMTEAIVVCQPKVHKCFNPVKGFTSYMIGHISSFNRLFNVFGLNSNSDASTCLSRFPLVAAATEGTPKFNLFAVIVSFEISAHLIKASDKSQQNFVSFSLEF